MTMSVPDMQALARSEAVKHGIDPAIFMGLLEQESRWKPDAVSSAGAQGIAQFMPATAKSVGLANPFDPAQAIPASAKYLRSMIDQMGGSVRYGVAAYNAGAGRMKQFLAGKGKPLAQETLNYFPSIAQRALKYAGADGLPGVTDAPQAPLSIPNLANRAGAAVASLASDPVGALSNAARNYLPALPMPDGTTAMAEHPHEADFMTALMQKNYSLPMQQTLVAALPQVTGALDALNKPKTLDDGMPNDLDNWLLELIDRA